MVKCELWEEEDPRVKVKPRKTQLAVSIPCSYILVVDFSKFRYEFRKPFPCDFIFPIVIRYQTIYFLLCNTEVRFMFNQVTVCPHKAERCFEDPDLLLGW